MGLSLRRHPSRKALRDWLMGEGDPDIERHLDDCQRCATTLEAIDEGEQSGAIRDALAMALAPPPDLSERLEVGVSSRLDSREMFTVMGDLFSAGLETSRLLFFDEPDVGSP